ncbi:hypothetical protein CERZMDRAFT_83107 [Cercospora zeae-maydis SCOH1-5]|uniref:Uncharacterized protein n=1 Tax=Cercospora zeae-maydis SCOH1-5 TaxID=717836 RepID=A0A6A6FLY8_9PEZI|nr:hypothetical protein CERZMDRAFT_83107 [Cercospora zeae-maydis SCOH1-5]
MPHPASDERHVADRSIFRDKLRHGCHFFASDVAGIVMARHCGLCPACDDPGASQTTLSTRYDQAVPEAMSRRDDNSLQTQTDAIISVIVPGKGILELHLPVVYPNAQAASRRRHCLAARVRVRPQLYHAELQYVSHFATLAA